MLFAVEGGGFFSSSASGYSKGLSYLILGQRNEEKSMRVTPWSQYNFVDQESEFQLASVSHWSARRCASFVCFGCAAAGLENQSPPKVRPTQHEEVLRDPVFDQSKDELHLADGVESVDDNSGKKVISRKSSLKQTRNSIPVSVAPGCDRGKEHEDCEKNNDVANQNEKKKVQWTDTSGGELFEIREFETSEAGADDEFDANAKTYQCRIM